jgi:ATPase subunit of ABC transporter with duplicated ATPase domains
MLSQANTLLIDSPTIHLDLEAIQAVNKGLEEYKGALIVASHDHKLLETVCHKIVEIGELGSFVYEGAFDEYILSPELKPKRSKLYSNK